MDNEIFYNSEVMENLIYMYEEIQKDCLKINELCKDVDNEIQDMIHLIEFKNFNVPQGYSYVKKIKTLLANKSEFIGKKRELIEVLNFFKGDLDVTKAKVLVDEIVSKNEETLKKMVESVKDINVEDLNRDYSYSYKRGNDTNSFAVGLSEMIGEYNERRHELRRCMSEIEKNINSLFDKIKVEEFNMIEGYHMAKALKDLRNERRNIKDEFNRFVCLDKLLYNNPDILELVEKIEKHEEQKSKRIYTPRVLKSLGTM